ncbi:transcriptional repressor [Fusarium oxysporum]|nr:transcriptional repressor [Fusarium oxysporum]
MQSADRDHFFETDAVQASRQRKAAKASNKNGNPVIMKSKILAAVPDPAAPLTCVFIAESAGAVRRINLETSETKTTYRGPKAPVTCLATGGSWDKDIWSWDIETAKPGRKFSGHTDFVKTIICATVSGKHILISGGADKKIFVWDVESGKRLHTLQDPTTTMLAVQHLAIDPVLSDPTTVVFASGGSDRTSDGGKSPWTVTNSCPNLSPTAPMLSDLPSRNTRPAMQTSGLPVLTELQNAWRVSRNFVADDTLTHGDYVRGVLVTDQWVITAGRDENVKVWDRSSGKLYCTLVGHYEEVTDLVLLQDTDGTPRRVCSVGIDGTVRTWPLGKSELDEVLVKIQEAAEPKKEEEEKDGNVLTAEEEAELAELMDD